MSQETVELAGQVLGAISRRDAERLIALADPDVEWHSFFALGEGGMYRGHEGTRQYMKDLSEAWDIAARTWTMHSGSGTWRCSSVASTIAARGVAWRVSCRQAGC